MLLGTSTVRRMRLRFGSLTSHTLATVSCNPETGTKLVDRLPTIRQSRNCSKLFEGPPEQERAIIGHGESALCLRAPEELRDVARGHNCEEEVAPAWLAHVPHLTYSLLKTHMTWSVIHVLYFRHCEQIP